MPADAPFSSAISIFAPLAGDAQALAGLVEQRGHKAQTCDNAKDFSRQLDDHPLCAVLTEEALGPEVCKVVGQHVAAAPLWSSIPLVVAVNDAEHPPRYCRQLMADAAPATVVVLQRPVRETTFTTILQSQIELRQRQFQAAALMERLEEAQRHERFLLDELRHRTRNMLGILQATVQLASKNVSDVGELRQSLLKRLSSISIAHERLTDPDGGKESIAAIVKEHVGPFCLNDEQLELSGTEKVLPDGHAFDLAMVLHELATNAAKYGALSVVGGTVSVHWRFDDGQLALTWREAAGPEVSAPRHKNFGTKMIERIVTKYGGESELTYAPDGFIAELSMEMD